MTTVTIGGNAVNVGILSFYQIENAWPHFVAAAAEKDPIFATGHYCAFVASILEEQFPEYAAPDGTIVLKKRMRSTEVNGLANSVMLILQDNELAAKPGESGEAPGTAPANPSPETVPGLSAS